MMKLSVIGAAGFLGIAIRQYSQDNNFNILSFGNRNNLHLQNEIFAEGDLVNDFPFEKLLDQEMIFYCAGMGVQSGIGADKKKLYYINTYFPIALTEYLAENNYKGTLITFGSYFEIGNNSKGKKFSEKEIIASLFDLPNDYCISKRLFSRYIYDAKPAIKHFHFILPTIYGEHENKNRLIPYLIGGIKNKLPLSFTNGHQLRQYLYVKDLIKIIFSIKNQLPSGIYNMPCNYTLTIKELVTKIANYFNFSVSETIFNTTDRKDISMRWLQLDAGIIEALIPGFGFTLIDEVISKY